MATKRTPEAMDVQAALDWLQAHGSTRYREQLGARFGITTDKAFGTSMADVKQLAKIIGKDHALAQALWRTGWHEARALAACVADPKQVSPALMDAWCSDFSNWADCDTACFTLFDRTPHAFAKVAEWSARKPEFERRAAFALLAGLALHDKKTGDAPFLACLPLVQAAAHDPRNFVKKGVSWAARGMACRSTVLHDAIFAMAEELVASTDATERWVGKDVLKDITRPLIVQRAAKREAKRNTGERA